MSESQFMLNKFFKGHCSDQEKRIVLDWLSDPKNELQARAIMSDQWRSVSEAEADIDIDLLLSKTRGKLKLGDPNVKAGNNRKVRWFERTSIRIAASVTFIFMSTAVLLLVLRQDMSSELDFIAAANQVKTSTGQIILKVLPDGTKVWLNAQSKLEYPSGFGKTREVELQGEAFFDVVKDKNRPFIVHAEGLDIRVLGTAFNIKSYPGDPSIATTLVEGKVVIEIEEGHGQLQDKIVLKPNQQAIFSRESMDISLIDVDAQRYASWTDGSLVFEDDQVYDVLNTLERWYGVNIHVEDESNLTCRLTARIDKESITETLELLKSITGIRYSIDGNEVSIEGKVCAP